MPGHPSLVHAPPHAASMDLACYSPDPAVPAVILATRAAGASMASAAALGAPVSRSCLALPCRRRLPSWEIMAMARWVMVTSIRSLVGSCCTGASPAWDFPCGWSLPSWGVVTMVSRVAAAPFPSPRRGVHPCMVGAGWRTVRLAVPRPNLASACSGDRFGLRRSPPQVVAAPSWGAASSKCTLGLERRGLSVRPPVGGGRAIRLLVSVCEGEVGVLDAGTAALGGGPPSWLSGELCGGGVGCVPWSCGRPGL